MINGARRQRTALIVDDEVEVLSLLDDVLVEAGFATTRFELGKPAIAAIDQRHFDLLVIDVGLPDISGMIICEHARKQYGEGVAILIVTGDSRLERLHTALDLGADDFVPKPFDINELLTRIEVKLRRAAEFSAEQSSRPGEISSGPHNAA